MRGPMVDLYGRHQNGFQLGYVAIEPLEVLKGSPELRADGTVSVAIGGAGNVEELRSQLPADDNLWFLKRDDGFDTYYAADYVQISVLRDIDGEVRVILPSETAEAYSGQHYPLPLEGTSFEDLLGRVRDIISSADREGSFAFTGDGAEPRVLFAC